LSTESLQEYKRTQSTTHELENPLANGCSFKMARKSYSLLFYNYILKTNSKLEFLER